MTTYLVGKMQTENQYPNLMPGDRYPYPIELILTGIDFLLNTQNRNSSRNDPIRSLLLYSLVPFEEGYIPLNRDYKPIGLAGYDNWVNYGDYHFLMIDAASVNLKDLEAHSHTSHLFLFSDRTYPQTKPAKMRYVNLIKKTFSSYDGIREKIDELIVNSYGN